MDILMLQSVSMMQYINQLNGTIEIMQTNIDNFIASNDMTRAIHAPYNPMTQFQVFSRIFTE